MKRKKINNIIIFFLALIAFIFIVNTKSCEAIKLSTTADLLSGGYEQEHIDDTIYLTKEGNGTNSLERNPNMYCFQRALSTKDSTYTVRAHIVIDGNKATRYYHKGDRAKGIEGVSVYSTSNMVLGYIIENVSASGFTNKDNVRTASQVAVWGFGDEWMRDVGTKLFSDTWTVEDLSDPYEERLGRATFELPTKAKQYANAGEIPTPTVSFDGSSKKEYNNTENGEILGPFKVNFNSNRIHITSISVKDNYGNDIQDGIAFYLNKNGTNSVSANNITQDQEFYIKNTTNRMVDSITVNVETDMIYKVEMWFLHCYKESSQELVAEKSSRYRKYASTTLKIKSTGSLYIHKADEETGATLEGAGFKIYKKNSGWLKGTSYPYEFVNNISQATEYTMDNNNKTDYVQYGSFSEIPAQYQGKKGLKIDVLRSGIYHIYETKAPTGLYKLNLQNGYDGNNKYVDTGIEIKVGTQQDGASWDHFTNITNVQKISIKGYVWAEGRPDKPENNKNDIKYNNGSDHRVSNITVKLFKKGNENPIATTTTNTNGEYEFIDIVKRTELDNYYVLFDYGEGRYSYTIDDKTMNKTIKDGNKYIPVAFLNEEDGSKALAQKIPYEDTEVGSVAYTYGGNVKDMINTYGLAKIGTMDNENLVLKNINLGIKEIPTTEYNLEENLDYVTITMKRYTYKYYFGKNGDKQKVAAPRVKWQDGKVISAYTKEMYPSDIVYSSDSTKVLDVNVTYKIDITNTTNYNIEELYKEDKLVITSLKNEYDTNRYTLNDEGWENEKDGLAVYKGNKFSAINQGKTISTNITFNVKRQALDDMLKHPEGIIEEHPTKAITIGYHKYFRKDYSWQNNILKEQEHRTPDDPEDATAPYLIFKLGEERVVSGKVFEDGVVTTDGQVLGNGVYDENENVVKNVLVELIDAEDPKLPVSHLYRVVEKDGEQEKIPDIKDAKVYTGKDGKYELKGIVPGFYFLRFTYGDGSQKIYNIKGEEVNTLTAKDYKSTIITNKIVKEVLEGKENVLWYMDKDFDKKSSVAIDNLNTRVAVNENKQNYTTAGAAKMLIKIENTVDEFANIEIDENGNQVKANSNNFSGFYFGVIKQPKQDLDVEKVITNVKLTNTQGNILYNGNPEKLNQGSGVAVTDLDNKKNGGSSYVRAEMEETSIYGANLELTYEVRIKNISDINYYNETYYKYGIANKDKEVSLIPEDVYDYLDNSLQYLEERTKELNKADRVVYKGNSNISVDGEDIKAQKLELNGWGRLYTDKIKNRDEKHPTTEKVGIIAQRILSRQDNDMEIVSHVTVTNAKNSGSGDDSDEEVMIIRKPENINAYAKATFTLTPPTGNTTGSLTYYAIAGIVSLIVIAAGIVIIKKKIV